LPRAAEEAGADFVDVWGDAFLKAGEALRKSGDEMVGCSSWLGHYGMHSEDPATYAAGGCALANCGREFEFAGDTMANTEGCASMRAAAMEGAWTALRQAVNEFYIAAASGAGGLTELETSLTDAGDALERAVAEGENLDMSAFQEEVAGMANGMSTAADVLEAFGSEMASEQGVRVEAGQCLVRSASGLRSSAELLLGCVTER